MMTSLFGTAFLPTVDLSASCNEDTLGVDVGLFVCFRYEAISALAVEQGGQIGPRRSCVEQKSWTCVIVSGWNEWFFNR